MHFIGTVLEACFDRHECKDKTNKRKRLLGIVL
jgi:hypothetical protein